MTYRLSNTQARRLILHLQGLTHPPHKKLPAESLYALIHQLGFVQVDSIQWVERAHHMILFARNQTYRPHHLTRLIEKDRLLFENWTHDASIIPAEFFPYWRHKFDRDRPRLAKQFNRWQGEGYGEHCSDLLERIRTGGSLRSRDLERADSGPREMWQWHDGKAALEYLWRTGALCIAKREGFQKVYDLTERSLLKDHHDARVDHDAFIDWACRSALDRLGFGSAGDIARYWNLVTIAEVNTWLSQQENKNGNTTITRVDVEASDRRNCRSLWARGDISFLADAVPDVPARMRALSPFDPVIRDRKRLSWLFGFDYRIEIYVPEAKRQWGYYVYPLLEGDRLIGRIDMRAKRKEDCLEVKRLWLEPKIKLSKARETRLQSELTRQARLGGVSRIEWLNGALDGINR